MSRTCSAPRPGGDCDSALHACVVEWDDTVPAQLASLVADGISTVKMFTTYRGETMANERTILHAMAALRDLGGMVVIHREAAVRPAGRAVGRLARVVSIP